MTCGIYALVFDDYDPFYVGQSSNIEVRYAQHIYALARKDCNFKLLQAYAEYGKPELYILDTCLPCELDAKELYYISKFDCVDAGLNEWAGPVSVMRGERHPNAKYTDSQVREVIIMLADAKILPFRDISTVTGVSVSAIQNISSGKTASHFEAELPNEYIILKARRGNRVSSASSAYGRGIVYPTILSPSGNEYKIENVTKFAKEHGLNMSHLCGVLNGVRKSHLGWRLK